MSKPIDIKHLLKLLAKKKGFAPLTLEEARKAYDEAEPAPMTEADIKRITDKTLSLIRESEQRVRNGETK